ncbi:MAG: hypothetical protein KA712_03910 [Myxococcales bacterium]|nr:hypothetical protein [Myxococcales bacterium]
MSTRHKGAMNQALSSRLIVLRKGPCEALLYPERGFQLLGFRAPSPRGERTELLHVAGEAIEPSDRRYGNPILFPAVGVSNGAHPDSWEYGGKSLAMPPHGWARNVYWQIEASSDEALTAVLLPHPGWKAVYPFDFSMRLTYRFEGTSLVADTVIENAGEVPMPYALGFHPYLRMPLAPQSRAAACQVSLPAGTRLRPQDGWRQVSRTPEAARTVTLDHEDLPGSIVLADTGATSLEVVDEAAGMATFVSVAGSEQSFPVWVAWNASPDAPYVCLEPWTDAPNALNRPGTRKLDPGQTHRYRMAIGARAF